MIQGDVGTFLNALGAREGDPRLERALAFVGGNYKVDAFDEGGVKVKYLVIAERGVEFLLEDGALAAVFVSAADTDDLSLYGGWASLVEGVGPDASPDDVVRALGAPIKRTSEFVRYEADPGFVQFAFDGDSLTMLVMLEQVQGDQASDASKPELKGVETVDGELAVFMRAIDRPLFSPEHVAIIGLAGPASESFDEERGGVMWQYENSPRSGVMLQFKQEFLVGALIRLRSEEGEPAYPSVDQLIEGLALPSSRESIEAHFGTPRRSSQHMDLYLVDERYLRFDFEEGQSTALAVVSPGAEI